MREKIKSHEQNKKLLEIILTENIQNKYEENMSQFWGSIKGELSSYIEKLETIKLSIQPSKKLIEKGTKLCELFLKTI